jgi:hypothetical protein
MRSSGELLGGALCCATAADGGPRWWRGRSIKQGGRREKWSGARAPASYQEYSRGDGWGGGSPRWPSHVRAARMAALLRGHRRVSTPPAASQVKQRPLQRQSQDELEVKSNRTNFCFTPIHVTHGGEMAGDGRTPTTSPVVQDCGPM